MSIETVPVNGLVTEATIDFEFVDGNTAAGNITIATRVLGNATQTNTAPIVISIDKAPRVLSIGNSETVFNSDFSYTFEFSEPINDLQESDFVITGSGVSVENVTVNADLTATVTFTVAENTNGTFSIDIADDSYTDDGGNGNSDETELPIEITIDTIAPRVTSIGGNSATEFNESELNAINNEISYIFTFSKAIDGLETGDFEITPNSGVSSVSVGDVTVDDTTATVTFTVAGDVEIDDTFSISLKANS